MTVFISSTIAAAYKFVPYFEYLKKSEAKIFLASNYEGPPSVDSTNKTTDQINEERRELIPRKLNSDTFDRENVIILEEPAPISPQFGEGSVEVLKNAPEKKIFLTNSNQPKILFLEENYYGSWRAKVNSEDVRIFRANYGYMAVPLTAGAHTVEFYYESLAFKVGLVLSLIAVILLVVISRGRSLPRG